MWGRRTIWLSLLGTLIALCAFAASSSALAFHYTHTVDVSVTVTDHWTRTPNSGCDVAGSGTVRYTVTWRRAVKAQPMINSAAGRWTLLVPGPGGTSALDLAPQKVTGKISYSANVGLSGELCPIATIPSSGCHSYSLGTGNTVNVFGLDRRSLEVDSSVIVGTQLRPRGSCQAGLYRMFSDRDFFRNPMTVRMPAPGALHRHKLIVRGSSKGHFSGDDPANPNEHVNETVTRAVAVTFKRL